MGSLYLCGLWAPTEARASSHSRPCWEAGFVQSVLWEFRTLWGARIDFKTGKVLRIRSPEEGTTNSWTLPTCKLPEPCLFKLPDLSYQLLEICVIRFPELLVAKLAGYDF